MLTRKQQWRRIRERIHNPLAQSLLCNPSLSTNNNIEGNIDKIEHIPTIDASKDRSRFTTGAYGPAIPDPPLRLKSALSSSNLLGMAIGEARRRSRDHFSLRFSSTVHVLLIPSRLEMSSFDNIYWLHEDYAHFKREAVKEIREAARVYSIPAKAAMTLLYQPEPEGSADVDEAEGIVYEEEQSAYDYYDCDYATNFEYSDQNITVDYQYHITNHPAPMARKDSNYLLEQAASPHASPHSVTMMPGGTSPKTIRDIKFITNVKTDVELNADAISNSSNSNAPLSTWNGGSGGGGSASRTTHQPRRTTTNAPQKQHAWAVQWKKQSTTT